MTNILHIRSYIYLNSYSILWLAQKGCLYLEKEVSIRLNINEKSKIKVLNTKPF